MKRFMLNIMLSFPLTLGAQMDMTGSVNSFISSLSDQQAKKCSFELTDEERFNWNFVPTSRKGIAFRELNEKQQSLFMNLLRQALSEKGYEKASSIMQLESILRDIENRPANDEYRNPGKYYFSLFGKPSIDKPWGWRIEGHHLAFNFLHYKKEMTVLPSFMGSNPAIVPSRFRASHEQILKQESEKAFALLQSLTAEQQSIAIISEKPFYEIITGNDRSVSATQAKGLAFSKMNSQQQRLFRELLTVYIMNYNREVSDAWMKEIETSGFDQMYFAWAGATQWGKGHYYRIQGGNLWIEYDNVQNNANHVHTVVRSTTHDFGEDLLKKHYKEEHHQREK